MVELAGGLAFQQRLDGAKVVAHFGLAFPGADIGGAGLAVDECLVHGDEFGFFQLADVAGKIALGELEFFQQGVEVHRPTGQRQIRHDGEPGPVGQQRVEAHQVDGFHDAPG